MTDTEIRRIQALVRIAAFGAARATDFPAASLGGQKFAEIKLLVTELDVLGEAQASAGGAARANVETKRVARNSLLQKMRAIRETSKAMEGERPGVSNNFRVPTNNGDEALVNTARAFIAAATPLKTAFIQREMPVTFLEDLNAVVDEFESVTNEQNINTGKRVGATEAVKSTLLRTAELVRELNPIVRNKYRDDAASLAAWNSAVHVERPPKPSKKRITPSPRP